MLQRSMRSYSSIVEAKGGALKSQYEERGYAGSEREWHWRCQTDGQHD